MIRVTQFMRRPRPGIYSVERLYEDVRKNMSSDIQVRVRVSRFYSQGLWRRLYDAVAAYRHQGDINHVTGDVHFLTYFLAKRRTLLTILDCGVLEQLRGFKRWVLWFFWFWLAEKRCSFIVVISAETKKQLLRHLHCDPKKIRVIYCNVSSEFRPFPTTFNSDRPRLLQIGTTDNKNIERLAEAIKGLECDLVVIGKLSDSQQTALEQNSIYFENRVGLSRGELLDEYHSCDLLVFISTYEGFGLPIVEANAVGRPVVTSKVLSMPEVAGDAACLVDPFDITSIRAGICRVIDDVEYREQLVSCGFANAERFQASVLATQYAKLYKDIHQNAECAD